MSALMWPPRLRDDYDRPAHWTEQAVCASVDSALFFPPKGGSVRIPKRICFRCPVRVECLEFALADPETGRWGIWGGTTERQRREIQRQRRAEAVPDGPRLCGQALHPMTPENVYTGPDGTEEWCRACRRASDARRRRNKLKAVA